MQIGCVKVEEPCTYAVRDAGDGPLPRCACDLFLCWFGHGSGSSRVHYSGVYDMCAAKCQSKLKKSHDVTERIRELAKQKDVMSMHSFGDFVGISGNTANRGFRDDEWSRKTLRKVADAFDVPLRYLLYGPEDDVPTLCETPEGDIELPGVGRAAADSSNGRTVEFDHETPPVRIPRHTAAVEVRGHSLNPVAWEGQHVLVDTREGQDLSDNDLVVVETRDGRTYARRLHTDDGHITLCPVNPALKGQWVTLDRDEIKRAHRIVGVWFD